MGKQLELDEEYECPICQTRFHRFANREALNHWNLHKVDMRIVKVRNKHDPKP